MDASHAWWNRCGSCQRLLEVNLTQVAGASEGCSPPRNCASDVSIDGHAAAALVAGTEQGGPLGGSVTTAEDPSSWQLPFQPGPNALPTQMQAGGYYGNGSYESQPYSHYQQPTSHMYVFGVAGGASARGTYSGGSALHPYCMQAGGYGSTGVGGLPPGMQLKPMRETKRKRGAPDNGLYQSLKFESFKIYQLLLLCSCW